MTCWYIFAPDGLAIASCNCKPNDRDLQLRGEFAIESQEFYLIGDIKFADGKMVKITE